MSAKKGLMMMAVMLYFSTFVGCGSVGNSGSQGYSASSGTTAGKVGILIKDDLLAHPSSTSTDVPELSQLWVTINRVSLKMEDETEDGIDDEMDDEGWLTVFEGTGRYDLLTLQGNNTALMSQIQVPPGYYVKARLEIDETPRMNCFYALPDGMAGSNPPCTDPDAYLLTVPSGKVDIDFHPHIYIGGDTTQYIVFDLLPADSIDIKITDTNGEKGYLLRPEVHAYTMTTIMEDKGWDDINVEELEGHIVEVNGCYNPDLPDTLIFS